MSDEDTQASDDLDDPANVPDEKQANVQAMAYWDRVIEDMEATATELSEAGWETLEIHPGDVHVLPTGADPGLDVVVGNDEFDRLETLLSAGVEITETEVLRASTEGMQYLVVVMKDPDEETAILAPLYYRIADPDVGDMLEQARTAGTFCTRYRTLTDERADIHHEDPSLFASDTQDTDE